MDALAAATIGAAGGAAVAWLLTAARARHGRELHGAEVLELRDSLVRQERSSEATLHVQDLILSSMQDGVLLLDATGETAFANAALEHLLGMRPSSIGHLFPTALREVAQRASGAGATGSVLIEMGEPARFLRVAAAPAGEDGSVLVVVRDETEARRIDAIRRDFVANASHELKTPAASIQAAAETLRHAADDDPATVPRFAGQIEREALRLSRIVADLLDLSRLESGSELSERVALDALVREEAQRFEEPVRGAGLTLDVRTPTTAWVEGSARDLSLLVRNLVDNAIRYTRPGGSVIIEVSAEGGRVLLRVSDAGVGIPAKDLPRIFERFYRVDRARSRETGGTGLGLAIVKHVAENHGGTVEVRSELGQGTTFLVRLPARSAPADRVGA